MNWSQERFRHAMSEIQEIIHQNAVNKGFWEIEELGFCGKSCRDKVSFRMEQLIVNEKLALIHSEVSEALEANRESTVGEPKMSTKLPNFMAIEMELADVVIRVMDLADFLDIDLGDAILAKMNYNNSRPMKHGKQF